MAVKEEYDFIKMGTRCAKERMENLIAMADKIENEYGIDARLEFESGIAMVIPVYASNMFNRKLEKSEIERGGRKEFGIPKRSNPSYFIEELEEPSEEVQKNK